MIDTRLFIKRKWGRDLNISFDTPTLQKINNWSLKTKPTMDKRQQMRKVIVNIFTEVYDWLKP